LISNRKRRIQIKGVWEKNAKENILTYERGTTEKEKKDIIRSFIKILLQ
jgi:hypothetical protein